MRFDFSNATVQISEHVLTFELHSFKEGLYNSHIVVFAKKHGRENIMAIINSVFLRLSIII